VSKSKKKTGTQKLYPILMYYHHPARTLQPLERMLRWWNQCNTELKLIIRTVQKDPSLPQLEELWHELEIEGVGWLIGSPLEDTGEMILECYSEWKEYSRDLVYATDDPSKIALFVLTFEAQEPRDAAKVSK
jgi:hypothetical protein